jgi:glutaredoxin
MKDVVLYTTNTCPYCHMAKDFLKENNIYYIEKNLDTNPGAHQEFAQYNLRGVPAFVIGDTVIPGLDTERVMAAVDHRLVECDQCHAKLRVPVNKGKLNITCPECGNKFEFNP